MVLSLQKTAFSGDGTDDDDGGSIFYSSPTQMAIQVTTSPLLHTFFMILPKKL
jgi:hypothetical protein